MIERKQSASQGLALYTGRMMDCLKKKKKKEGKNEKLRYSENI